MKYWEVAKRLTENPSLSGLAVIGSTRYELYVDDSGTLQSATHYMELGISGTSLGKAVNIDFDGWEIVHQPVTWQEAIEAWVDGKKIRWECGCMSKVYDAHGGDFGELEIGLGQFDADRGAWHVED